MKRLWLVLILVFPISSSVFGKTFGYLSEYDHKPSRLMYEVNFFIGTSISNLGREPINLGDYYRRKEGKKADLCVSLDVLAGGGYYFLPYLVLGLESGASLYVDRQKFASPLHMTSLGGLWRYITPQWLEKKGVCKDMQARLSYTELGLPVCVYMKFAPLGKKERWFSLTGLVGVNLLVSSHEATYHKAYAGMQPFMVSESETFLTPVFTVGARLHAGIVGLAYIYNLSFSGMERDEDYHKARAHRLSIGFLYTLTG